MERPRYQRFLAMTAVFAMLFSGSIAPSMSEGTENENCTAICGMEEHIHTEECSENVITCGFEETEPETERRFIRNFSVHHHTKECFDESGKQICGLIEEKYYHTHNEYCYDEAGNLVCGLQEKKPHEHTEECYGTEQKLICGKEETNGHTHGESCFEHHRELICGMEEDPGHHHSEVCYTEHTDLTCGQEEDPGHRHNDDCYAEQTDLTCGQEEDPGHIHDDSCYTEHTDLTCGQEEDPGHAHSDSCYTEHTDLTCGQEEDPGHRHSETCYQDETLVICGLDDNEDHIHSQECYQTLRSLTCKEQEREGHIHDESCYTTIRELTCKEEEREGHIHDESCYTTIRELICEEKERQGHIHDESCYTTTRKLICTEKERDGHIHDQTCYTTTRDLICKEEERDGHTHTEDCFREWDEKICDLEEIPAHVHDETCYESYEVLLCEEPTTTHHHSEACRDMEGNLICGKLEIPEFICTEENWEEEIVSEGHRHTEACFEKRLICGKEEHIHTEECYPKATGEATEDSDENAAEKTTVSPAGEPEGEKYKEAGENPVNHKEEIAESAKENKTEQTSEEPQGAAAGPENETSVNTPREAAAEPSPEKEQAPASPTDLGINSGTTKEAEPSNDPEYSSDPDPSNDPEPSNDPKPSSDQESSVDPNTPEEPDAAEEPGTPEEPEQSDASDDSEKTKETKPSEKTEGKKPETDTEGNSGAPAPEKKQTLASPTDLGAEGNTVAVPEHTEETETSEKKPAENAAETERTEQKKKGTQTLASPTDLEVQRAQEEKQTQALASPTDLGTQNEPEEKRTQTLASPTDLGTQNQPEETAKDKEKRVLSAGNVSISFPDAAGIPEGTELRVSEAGGTLQKKTARTSAKRTAMRGQVNEQDAEEEPHATIPSLTIWNIGEEEPEIILYQQTLDISLISEGKEIEPDPEAEIEVTVELPEIEEGQDVDVTHISEKGKELLESTNVGGKVVFVTNGFSLFEFISRPQQLINWNSDRTEDSFQGKTRDQKAEAAVIPVTGAPEGLEIEEGIQVTSNDGLWMTMRYTREPKLGKLENLVLYTVEDGKLGAIVREDICNTEYIRFNTGEMSSFAIVKDSGLRRRTKELDHVTLDGMMPKNATAEATDVTEIYSGADFPAEGQTKKEASEAQEDEEEQHTKTPAVLAAYDISILNRGEEYQPDEEHPIRVEIRDERIKAGGNIELWHIRDDGTKEQVTEFEAEAGRIEFLAAGFSVYAIVPGPEEYVMGDAVTVQNLQELAENYNNPDTGAKGFYLSYTNGGTDHYFTNLVVNNGKGDVLKEAKNIQEAAVWYLERAENENTYYLCTKVNNEYKRLAKANDNPNNYDIKLDTAGTAILFSGSDTDNQGAPFYLKHSAEGLWLQHSGSGNGIRFYNNKNNAANSQITLTYVYSARMPDDPYNLDGKQYGLIRYKSGISGRALNVNSSGSLTGQEMLVKENPLNRNENLYVAKNSNISMWKFNTEGADLYTLSTDVNGSTRFLKINSNGLALVETEDAASRIQVIPGKGSFAGKVRLKDSTNNKTIKLNNNTFSVENDNDNSADQYLNFAELSELEEDDFVAYSAQKVSIADNAEEATGRVSNGDLVVIYTRRWNDDEKKYEFYIVDHNGDLVYAYEEGGSIQWIGTKINTALWQFTEYYWEGTDTPNYYYELKNDYSNQFLAPQVNGQIFSDNTIGLNLNGRRYNDYYSTILAWDDPTYAYAGIKTKADGSGIESCRIGKAEDFYFAKMDLQSTDTLTPVTTIDHTKYGITMKIVDFNNSLVKPDNTNTDSFQHAVMGNSHFDASNGVKNLLTTDLKMNGYPDAQLTNRSLGELFAAAYDVNHLFLDSTFYGSGYFSYDSAQNFASLHGNQFTVYKEIGTSDSSGKESLQHGNFFPFNDIRPGHFAVKNPENLYSATLEELDEDNPRKHEKLYLVDQTDYYFGMEISASFVQTPNGKDAWNHDIIYEFIGDDDFWLYVDGELVVDLGGIHSALGAKVNFASGTVNVSGKEDTLYEIFKRNYKTRNSVGDDDPGLQDYLAEKFTQKNGKWVFKDYSTHTMRIFYMERGAGASNLKMRFNLASVNPNRILLTKEVSGIADAEFLTTKFPYQIWFQPPRETDYQTMVQEPLDAHGYRVTYKNTNEEVEFRPVYTVGNAAYENVFFLKPGQTVEINTPDSIGKYRIVECGVPGNIYNKYTTDGQPDEYRLTVNDETIPGKYAGADAGNPLYDYSTDEALVTERAQVVFTNHVNEDYLRTLSITKKLLAEDGITELSEAQDPTGFRYRLFLGESLGYYSMGDYYVKNPEGKYCRFEDGHFVSIGKDLFDDLTEDDKYHVTFTTSPAGSIDKIPTGYTVEIRDLPVGTKFKVEEWTEDLPEGYMLKGYERDSQNPYICHGNVFNEGEIQEGNNARLYVINQRGWGLTAKKVWTDKSFTQSHDPVYVAIYTGPNGSDLLEGSVREIVHPSTSVYYYINELLPGKTFSDYSINEVILEGPTVADGVVTGYRSITRIAEGMPVEIGAKKLDGTDVAPVPKYLVAYDQGKAEGVTDNIRTDVITNQREGGVIIRLYDWVKDWNTPSPDQPIMLSGGVFKLEKKGEPAGAATYTSDSRGLITILYDFEADTDYILTQISAPSGYQGLAEPLIFSIPETKDAISVTANQAITGWYKAEMIDPASSDNLIAYVNVKNRGYTLAAKKIDPDQDDPNGLPGAHFALYKQYTGKNGNPVKDYYPIPGYEDIISGLDGIVADIDQTLAAWTYYLTETEAPTNYDKHEEDIVFTISELGYVTTVPSGYLTEAVNQDGTVEYTISIPNKKLVLVPPVLYVSKTVEGNGAQKTKPFRFTISGLTPNKEYVYQKFETVNGTDYEPESGAAALGFIKVNSAGEISFDLMHYEKIGFSLPYGSTDLTVCENSYDEYSTSYVLGEAERVTGNTVQIGSFLKDIDIRFTNSINERPVVAPTAYTSGHTPFILLLAFGLILILISGCLKMNGKTKRRIDVCMSGDNEERPHASGTGLPPDAYKCGKTRDILQNVNDPGLQKNSACAEQLRETTLLPCSQANQRANGPPGERDDSER